MAFIRSVLKTENIRNLKTLLYLRSNRIISTTKVPKLSHPKLYDSNVDKHSNTNDLDKECFLTLSNSTLRYSFKPAVDAYYKNLISNTLPYFFAVVLLDEKTRKSVTGHLIDKTIVQWPTTHKRSDLAFCRWRRLEGFLDIMPQIEEESNDLSTEHRLNIALTSLKTIINLEKLEKQFEMNDILENVCIKSERDSELVHYIIFGSTLERSVTEDYKGKEIVNTTSYYDDI